MGATRRRLLATAPAALLGGCLELTTGPAGSGGTETPTDDPAGPTDATATPADAEATATPGEDLALDGELKDLTSADDPASLAAEYGIPYDDGAVRVEVKLRSADAETPPELATINTRRDDRVDAWVAVDDLRALARRERVAWVGTVQRVRRE